MNKLIVLSFLMMAFTFRNTVMAQATMDTESVAYYKPKAILMMLHHSTTLIKSYERQNDREGIRAVELSDERANSLIMSDFSAEFDYCPIYYFYDNEHEQAIHHQFSQMHFFTLKDQHRVDVELSDTLRDYYFADINYPPITYQVEKEHLDDRVDPFSGDEGFVSNSTLGLNIYLPDFKPVTARFGRVKCFRKTIQDISNPYAVSGRFQKALNRRFRVRE